MGGHEGNTNSIPARCLFFVSLITTIYCLLVLSDIWPRESEKILLSLQKVQGKSDVSSVDVNSLNALLAKLDYHYTHEVNVDHHDHEENHGDEHTSSESTQSSQQGKDHVTPASFDQKQSQHTSGDLSGLREAFTQPGLKIEIPPTVAAVVNSHAAPVKESSAKANAKVIDLEDWQDDLDLDGLLDRINEF